MDSGIRVSAGAGLIAFVLSTLVGAFSRISFGIILIRALLLGILFGLLGFGVVFVYRRFLSDSSNGEGSEDSFVSEGDSERGQVVDIVLPEGPGVDYSAVEQNRDMSEDDATAPLPAYSGGANSHEMSSNELAKEVESIRAENTRPSSSSRDVETAHVTSQAVRPSVSMDTLDVLPDLDVLSDSFIGSISEENDGESAPRSDVPITGSFSSGGSSGDGGDPVLLAKAVQTLLRKDQKGQ